MNMHYEVLDLFLTHQTENMSTYIYIYIYLYRQNVYVSSPIDQAEAEQVSIPAQSDTTVPQWE